MTWLKTLLTQTLPQLTRVLNILFFSQQAHHQPGSSSHQQGEFWAAAPACGHPGPVWTLFQRVPGRRRAHSTLLLFTLNGLTWFVIVPLNSFIHFFSGRKFQTGRWPDVHTAEKCKIFCSPVCFWEVEKVDFSFNHPYVSAVCLSSSIGRGYPRKRSLLCFLLFIVLVASTAGLMVSVCVYLSLCTFKGRMILQISHDFYHQVGTWKPAQNSKGIYVSWVLLILLTLLTVARTIYWICLKISNPISNIT